MYKIQKLAVIILLLCCSFNTIFAQRNVFFIHGVNGSNLTWQNLAANLTTTYSGLITNKSNRTYDTDNGIQGFVTSFKNQNPSTDFSQDNDIAICHSLGGIMMRNFDLNQASYGKIGGIITVGTPFKGAQIANSFNDLTLKNYLDDAYYQLKKGINNDGLRTIELNQKPDLQQLFDAVESFKYDNFIQNSGFKLSQPTINDLAVNTYNANYQDVIQTATATHKLSIYGSEADPAFWRLIGSLKFNDSPDEGVVQRNKLADGFRSLRDLYNGGFINFITSGDAHYEAQLYQDAADWVDNTSTTGWQRVIGAGDFERQSLCYTTRTINWSELSYCFNQYGSNYQAQQNCINQYSYNVTICYTPFANSASDGFIVASSAVGQYTNSWSNAEDPVVVNLMNHVDEPANNQRMRDAFAGVFRKQGSYFQIQ